MNFKEAYELPIGNHVEKKGRFSYLSWVYAVKYLRENYPEAQWIIHENVDQAPIFRTPKGYMVKVSVVVDGQPYTQWHPITDNKNKPILEPDCFDINTSIQRALTKAIGLATGIGLALYAGEDLPVEVKEVKEEKKITDKQAKEIKTLIAKKDRDIEKLLAYFQVESVEELTENQYGEALDTLAKEKVEE